MRDALPGVRGEFLGQSLASGRARPGKQPGQAERSHPGEAFTITPRCASPPTASWSPRRRRFPPQDLPARGAARNLEVLPLRSQRHMPHSIATLRIRLAHALRSHTTAGKTRPGTVCVLYRHSRVVGIAGWTLTRRASGAVACTPVVGLSSVSLAPANDV
jgi:hypothetical protein